MLHRLQSYASVANITDIGVQEPKWLNKQLDNRCVSTASRDYTHLSDTCDNKVGASFTRTGTCTAGRYGGTLALETCSTDADCHNIPSNRFVCVTTKPPDSSSIPKEALGYCGLKVQESLNGPYSKVIQIPYWNQALMSCTHDANCSQPEVRAARKCEHRACRVGAQFGGGRLLGTSCQTSSDCEALAIDNFRCLCDSVEKRHCADPLSGVTDCYAICGDPNKMRCAYAPTGQPGTTYPIPGYELPWKTL